MSEPSRATTSEDCGGWMRRQGSVLSVLLAQRPTEGARSVEGRSAEKRRSGKRRQAIHANSKNTPRRHPNGIGAGGAALSSWVRRWSQRRRPRSLYVVSRAGPRRGSTLRTVDVPENRATKGGRTIPLRVVILPAARRPERRAKLCSTSLAVRASPPRRWRISSRSRTRRRDRHTTSCSSISAAPAARTHCDCALYGSSGDIAAYFGDQFPRRTRCEPARSV